MQQLAEKQQLHKLLLKVKAHFSFLLVAHKVSLNLFAMCMFLLLILDDGNGCS